MISRPLSRFATAVVDAGSLVVTDRRWTAPLSAVALGFGLFVGVAIGPGSGPLGANGAGQVVELLQPPAAPVEEEPVEAAPADVTPVLPSGGDPLPVAGSAPVPGGNPSLPRKEEEKEPDAEQLTGTVVHVNPAAGSYSLATDSGELYALHHLRAAPVTGLRVRTSFRRLANGTLAERGNRERLRRASGARLSGYVTFIEPSGTGAAYTISMPGVSAWVRVPEGSRGAPPALGSFATVAVRFESPPATAPAPTPVPPVPPTPDPPTPVPPAPPAGEPVPEAPLLGALIVAPSTAPDAVDPGGQRCVRATPPAPVAPAAALIQETIAVAAPASTYGSFAGLVQAFCPETQELLLSADDIREGGFDVTLAVPAGFDLSALHADDPILAAATIGAGGELTLTGIASDRGIPGADDVTALQGDFGDG